MPRSNRKAHSRGGNFTRTVKQVANTQQEEIKLTPEQIEQDQADQKKFFQIIAGLTVLILIILYFLFFRNL